MSAVTTLKSLATTGVPIVMITISKDALVAARDQARSLSRRLHRIENLSELDWEEMNVLCRTINQTEALLQRMLDAENDLLAPAFHATD